VRALERIDTWPVPHAAAAAVVRDPEGRIDVATHGDPRHRFRLASISKPLTAWATLVAVEEGIVSLDDPVGQPGCTLRHLLAHAGGYGFDGAAPISGVGRRRIYSNTGIELAADHVAAAAGITFADYLAEAVLQPLGMTTSELRSSAAYGVWSCVDDLVRFVLEVLRPTLITQASATMATTPAFGGLRGMVPGVGSYADCSWGLGFEIHADKHPHWMGTSNSPSAVGHFGGAGTLLWVDTGAVHDREVACIALTDRMFDEWSSEALQRWPELSDALLAEISGADPAAPTVPTGAGR
jgi:CubicO group peptidase (beta-lactamase class C family)